MHIYPAELVLWEHTYFASREIDPLYATEPLIGNYALTYALDLCRAPYHIQGGPRYKEDFLPLNEQGLYVTPAFFRQLRMVTTRFNAQIESYYYRFTNNAITMLRPDEARKINAVNYPQNGRIRMLGQGSRAQFYVLDRDHRIAEGSGPRLLPYIRLGKFMSKARVLWGKPLVARQIESQQAHVSGMLNAADIENQEALLVYSAYHVHPAPILYDVEMSGRFWQGERQILLPAGLRYGVERL
jgi:CRISPR-associated protein Csc1